MLEKLPAPFGLVRYGVAPDHPEVKVKQLLLNLTLDYIECYQYIYTSCQESQVQLFR